MFDNLKKQDDVKADGDVIFSSVFETGAYDFTIDVAYADQSEGGAAYMNLSLVSDTGRTMNQRIFFTSGDAKGNSITYDVKKNGKPTGEKRYLPGFTIVSDLHEIITGSPLAEMQTEGKLVKVYNKDAGKEIPEEKAVLTALVGQKIKLGIQEQQIFKTVNQDGKYVETTEITKRNEVVKVFNAETGQTQEEMENDVEALFLDKWIATYAGKMVDKTGGKKGAESKGTTSKSAPTKQKMFG